MSNEPINPNPIDSVKPTRSVVSQLYDWRMVAGVVVVVVACLVWRAGVRGAKGGVVPNPKMSAAVTKVTRQDLVRELSCEAELRPYQEVELHAKVAGYLQKINVDIGDKVQAGQWIATIEVPELADDIQRAKASLKRYEEDVTRAQASADDAKLIYDRLSSVEKSQPNLIAQQELDSALEKSRTSASSLAAAQAEVDVAKAELSKLQTMLKYTQIAAPFSGTITRRYMDPGALVQPGTSSQGLPLVRLSQNDRLRLDIPVSVSHLSLVHPGDSVEVHVDSLERPFSGKIARSAQKVETATRTMIVEVDVSNSDLKLIPGMYASVLLRLEHREKTLCVPVEAVSRQPSSSVLLVDKLNKVENREVSLGLETPERVEIVNGLNENDMVVVGNKSQFKPGQEVEPRMVEQARATE